MLLQLKMSKAIDKEHSYQNTMFKTWEDLNNFFDDNDKVIIMKLIDTESRYQNIFRQKLKI
jgi:hypothetical protein